MDFKELVIRDAQLALDQELDNLKTTFGGSEEGKITVDKEFDGYSKLFAKFLAPDSRKGVEWDKIHRAPKELVNASPFT